MCCVGRGSRRRGCDGLALNLLESLRNALGNGSRALGCTGVTWREPWRSRVVVAQIIIGCKFGTVDGSAYMGWSRVSHTRPRLRLLDVILLGMRSST